MSVQYPCRGCVYFKACGELTRRAPCLRRKTKREAKKAPVNVRTIDQSNPGK